MKKGGKAAKQTKKTELPPEIDSMDMEERVFEAVVASPHRRNAARRWMRTI